MEDTLTLLLLAAGLICAVLVLFAFDIKEYWVANADAERHDRDVSSIGAQQAQEHSDEIVGDSSGTGSGRDAGTILGAQGGRLWSVPDESFITGPDGKRRPIKPGLEPLVNGLPGRVGLLRGYGNAIVPQVAAAFIESYLSV